MFYITTRFRERLYLLLNAASQYILLGSSQVYVDLDQVITEISFRLLDFSRAKELLEIDEYSLVKARQEDLLLNSGYKKWRTIRLYIT